MTPGTANEEGLQAVSCCTSIYEGLPTVATVTAKESSPTKMARTRLGASSVRQEMANHFSPADVHGCSSASSEETFRT